MLPNDTAKFKLSHTAISRNAVDTTRETSELKLKLDFH